jgi:Xaa-Pro aminopeptidase
VHAAAQSAIEQRGLGAYMKHAVGHGAGFGSLDHTARPRLHPKSDDVIEDGMVLKIELGVYCGDLGGVRMSDMVAVTDGRCEPLTAFHWDSSDLAVAS